MEYLTKRYLIRKGYTMKKILTILFCIINVSLQAQDIPTNPEKGFAFPIGTKFTLKLHPVDSINYDISVIEFEPFTEVIDSWDNNHLFSDKGENNTIVCYFCFATRGDTEEEKEKNMKIYLLFKNYSKEHLQYKSDIQRSEDGEFESTSNVGMFPSVKGTEIWPYAIYAIGLHDFQKYNSKVIVPDEK